MKTTNALQEKKWKKFILERNLGRESQNGYVRI